MRWFKHLSNAHNDEDMAELMDEFGAEGYGVWWLILEKIASQMDKTERCFARYSLKKWAKSCQVSAKKFQKIANFLSKLEKLSTEKCKKNPGFLIIECRNLLKFRDEYTKKSGQSQDKRRKKSASCQEQETETEAEAETEADVVATKADIIPQIGELKPVFEQMRKVLAMTDREITAVYGKCSDPPRLAEAFQCAVEFDARLRKSEGKALDDPVSYISKMYDCRKVSGKTRFRQGENNTPVHSEKIQEPISQWEKAKNELIAEGKI